MALRKRNKKSLNHMKSSGLKRRKVEEQEPSESIPEFFVECIRDHRVNTDKNEIEFLVKWRDYGEEENTWQNFYFFSQDQPDMVEKYFLKLFGRDA
jgi:hypothetical protein